MPDATGKKLLELLDSKYPPPVRRAAAIVLGEVGSKDKGVADALCSALDDTEADVRIEAVTAAGRLRIEKALPQLLARVKVGGPESEAAAHAAARLGARGVKGLQDLMGEVAPGLRRRIAGALATGGTAGAETAAVQALLDTDPGVIDAAARSLLAEVPTLTEAARRRVADRVLELMQPKKGARLPAESEAALLRLLRELGDPRGEPVFWSRIDAPHSPELRAAALLALGSLPAPPAAAQIKRVLTCASEPNFRVAAPALMILKSITVSAKVLKDWLPLFQAPDVAVRRFAIEKLGGFDTTEVAAGLVSQLRHPDRGLRDLALDVIAKLEHGRAALADELLGADSPDQAWALARAQATLAKSYKAALRTRLFNQACKYLEADDRRADALLFLLREGDAKDLRDRLEERALALRKKKQYPTALAYLRLLGRDPALGEALRFELAACGLKTSPHDLATRVADPALQQFAKLIHTHETDPAKYVEKAAWLAPEDLLYLGFHFAEGAGPERAFAGKVLRLLVKKSPKTQAGKDAKSKIRSAGLD
jgi:HEAT repeat protein